jgi:uncharacterized membrane protein YbhN (UPF0104 family)
MQSSSPIDVAPAARRSWSLDEVRIDDLPEPPRTRRSSDLLRLILTLVVTALVVLAGSVQSETTAGLQEDITTAVTTVPDLVVSLLATLNSLIVLALPLYLIADLTLRRRWRLLGTSLLAAAIALIAALLFDQYADDLLSGALLDALTQPVGGGGARTAAAFGLFAAVVALVTVEGSGARPRTLAVVWISLAGLAVLFLIDRRATPLALMLSVLAGHAIGLAVRYLAGSENLRASTRQIVEALARVGVEPAWISQLDDESTLGRRYRVGTIDGVHGVVQLLDPDRSATRLLGQLTRVVRVRTWVTRSPGLSARAQVQQAAVPVLMARSSGVRTPRLLAAAEVDDRSMLFAEEHPAGLRELGDFSEVAISDEALAQAWREIRRMHHAGVAHEGLHPGSLAVDRDGRVWILGLSQGEIAAPRLRMRLDRAELLVATALLVGTDRAITAAEREIGPEDLANLPALLQPIALNPAIRAALKGHDGLLESVREEATARAPEPSADSVKLERLRPRTVVSIVAATFAVYVLAGQLGNVNFATVLRSIDWWWAGAAVLASLLTYVGSALTIRPFSPVHVTATRWMAAQFAATFVTLVAPAAVGSAGTNVRVIQKAGAPSGLAIASVGVSTLVSLVTTVVAFVGVTLVSQEDTGFDVSVPSSDILLLVGGVVALIALAFAVPVSRRIIIARLRPTWESTGPRLLDVVRDPKRLLEGVGGSLLTSLSYALTLFAAVKAYGADIPIAAAVVVYLGAGLLGSVAPTPGGIGAVEAALVAGLSAVGVPADAALPAALLYRTVTFWLPTVPGWLAFQWLQRRDAI